MDKKQAAQYLGVSERAIERYKASGKLSAELVRKKGADGKPRPTLEFSETELDRLKTELDGATILPETVRPSDTLGTHRQSAAHAVTRSPSDTLGTHRQSETLVQRETRAAMHAPSDKLPPTANTPPGDTHGQENLLSAAPAAALEVSAKLTATLDAVTTAFQLQRLDKQLSFDLHQAALFSGMPASYLRRAITEKRLPAKRRGRGWNILRRDLLEFVDND